MPKVSVLLPNYNREQYLDESISSVLKQTFDDFELIIVDDASTDASRTIIDSYTDPRIRRHYSEKNRHIAYSLNVALSMAAGEYIARIDSDDIWEPDKLELQVQYMNEHPECGACFTRVNVIDKDSMIANDVYKEYYQLFNTVDNMTQKEWIRYFFYKGNCLSHPSVMMRKSALDSVGGTYHLAYVTAEDYELWTRMVMRYPIHIMDEKLVRCRWEESEHKISGETGGKKYAFPNVWMLTRKRVMEQISDDDFIRYFGDDFVNKESRTHEELECEKAHILLRCSGKDVNFLGLEKYEELLGDTQMLEVLEDKMNFSLSAYYREYRTRNFDLYGELESSKRDIDDLKRTIECLKNDIRQLQGEVCNKQQETRHWQNMVDEVMSSTSWKVTSPLRKAMRILRRK